MASPDITPGGGVTLMATRLVVGKERSFIARPGGYYIDKNGNYVPDDQRPTKVVRIKPFHPVYIDSVTGEEKIGHISL